MPLIKTVKKVLPVAVFMMLGTATLVLQLSPSREALILVGGATASSIALLLYAVIRWDDVHATQQREHRELADVVGRSTDAILIGDPDGHILYANAAARETYGDPCSGQQVAAATLGVLGLEHADRAEIIAGVLGGRPWKGELSHVTAGGMEHVSFVNLFRLEAFQGAAPVVAVIAHDLTERRALQAQLLHSQKLAAVGELAAGLAHEINNPMAAIQSQVGLARDLMCLQVAVPNRDDQLLECIDEVARQVGRCSHIVQSLLRFSRRQKQDISAIDLHEAIEQALTFVRTLPKMRHVELVHDPRHVARAMANLESVTQILVNLLMNAADATVRSGRVVVTVHGVSPECVAVEVQDDGSGIAPEVLERVFEPFFTTKPAPHGTGLGLSISYGLAHSLGGDLTLQSNPAGGSVATLTLPRAAAVREPLASV